MKTYAEPKPLGTAKFEPIRAVRFVWRFKLECSCHLFPNPVRVAAQTSQAAASGLTS
jgi:hypothetical protein